MVDQDAGSRRLRSGSRGPWLSAIQSQMERDSPTPLSPTLVSPLRHVSLYLLSTL